MDAAFTLLFVIEAIIKILAFGFINTSLKGNVKPYLFVGWNILDLFVVITSMVDFLSF